MNTEGFAVQVLHRTTFFFPKYYLPEGKVKKHFNHPFSKY